VQAELNVAVDADVWTSIRVHLQTSLAGRAGASMRP